MSFDFPSTSYLPDTTLTGSRKLYLSRSLAGDGIHALHAEREEYFVLLLHIPMLKRITQNDLLD